MAARSKPTLGYPSKVAAIVALHDAGVAVADIADRVGTRPKTVRARLHEQGRTMPRSPAPVAKDAAPQPRSKGSGAGPATLFSRADMNYDVRRRLRPHAARRGTTVDQVARELVEAALDKGLVDSMLAGRF